MEGVSLLASIVIAKYTNETDPEFNVMRFEDLITLIYSLNTISENQCIGIIIKHLKINPKLIGDIVNSLKKETIRSLIGKLLSENELTIVNLFLENGYNFTPEIEYKYITAICKRNDKNILNYIFEKGVKFDLEELEILFEYCDCDTISFCLDWIEDCKNEYCIYCAVQTGDIKKLKLLVDRGYDVLSSHNSINNAVRLNLKEIVSFYIDNGYDLNQSEFTGLDTVVYRGYLPMLKLLIQGGINIPVNVLKRGIPHSTDIIELLIDNGASWELNQHALLINAIEKDNLRHFIYLLNLITNIELEEYLDISVYCGAIDILKYFLDEGYKVHEDLIDGSINVLVLDILVKRGYEVNFYKILSDAVSKKSINLIDYILAQSELFPEDLILFYQHHCKNTRMEFQFTEYYQKHYGK